MILLLTKGVFEKEDSFVRVEYRLAQDFRKDIFVLFMEDIRSEDVPIRKKSWWFEMQDRQCLPISRMKTPEEKVHEVKRALGIKEEVICPELWPGFMLKTSRNAYTVVRLIGSGGTGQVYKVKDNKNAGPGTGPLSA